MTRGEIVLKDKSVCVLIDDIVFNRGERSTRIHVADPN